MHFFPNTKYFSFWIQCCNTSKERTVFFSFERFVSQNKNKRRTKNGAALEPVAQNLMKNTSSVPEKKTRPIFPLS